MPCCQLGWKRLLTEKMRTILEMWADDMRLSLRGHAWHAGQPKIPFWRLSSCFRGFQRCRVLELNFTSLLASGAGQAGFAKFHFTASGQVMLQSFASAPPSSNNPSNLISISIHGAHQTSNRNAHQWPA